MAHEEEDRRNPNSFVERAKAPVAEALQGLSTTLMQGAFESFGRAFTDTGYRGHRSGSGLQGIAAGTAGGGMDAWRAAGAKAATGLEKRWHTMELEDFKHTAIHAATEQLSELHSNFRRYKSMLNDGVWVEEDGTQVTLPNTEKGQERLRRYHSELFTDVYARNADIMQSLTQAASQYPNNPDIAGLIHNVFAQSSEQMNGINNPKESIAAEKSYSDIAVQERTSKATMIQARASAKAAKQADRPISVKEALADPNIGVANILPWAEDVMMASAQAGAYIEQGKAVLTDQLNAAHKAEWVAQGGKEKDYDLLDPENIAWVDSQLAQSGGAIQRAATVEFVRAKDPMAAKRAKQYSPQYFELMDSTTAPDAPKGIISDKRITEGQRDDNVKAWKQPLAAKLEEYMSDSNNDPDIEVAIDYIVNEWLPGAITGTTKSSAPLNIQATQSEGTKKYRDLVARYARRYLENEFYKISKIAAEQNKAAALTAKKRIPNRRGGLGRAITSLFGDE